MSTPAGDSLRPLLRGVYLPALLFSVGVGAMTPMIAVSAIGLGASPATAALVAALVPIGHILADVPAGAIAARFGERPAMIGSSLLAMAALATCALAPNLWVLGVAVTVVGATAAVYGLARQTYLTEVISPMRRARALASLGGVGRIGTFLGPFLGAALVLGRGDAGPSYWLGAATSLLSAVVVWWAGPAARERVSRTQPVRPARARVSTWSVFRDLRPVFTTLGIAVILVGSIRGARQTVLPLWTESLGYAPATTSVVFGVAGGVDMLLFYPAGKVMDRMGRLWIAIPSMAVTAGAMAVLPLTEGLVAVSIVAVVLGLGNGIGSGVLMTLGADAAPEHARAQFLGIWRLYGDAGMAAGPLVVSAGAALGSLAAGIGATGGLGVLAVLALARWVPRWSVHANRTTRRRAGLLE
ncbi:MFS transporter [Ruania alba]|uniref:Predicted arabinose efflux permease, MFS family n=1 Tax=Ruania alba TaxID=648782 RepID=A0A1H5MWG6_9MICO|nr:MFS transporter [Ruania alba]SEE93626.1 Predicted arabinose efflux permease, MFS family [Ruania alba]